MKKIVKIIGAAGAVAAAAALIPYHFKNDKESGEFELGGLLWKLRKETGEEEDTYTMELLPFIDKKPEEEQDGIEVEVTITRDDDEEAPVEEPFAQKAESEIVVEPAGDAAEEEPFAGEDKDAAIEIEVETPEEAPAEEPKAE